MSHFGITFKNLIKVIILFIKSKIQAYINKEEIEREGFMEYTKDMILERRYNEVHKVVRAGGTSWKSRALKMVRSHKIATATVISAVIFVSIDMVLITNFIHILSLV